MRPLLIGLCALICAASSTLAGPRKPDTRSPAAAAAPVPQIQVLETQLSATADFKWVLTMLVRNPTDHGIYTDSMQCEITDLGEGVSRGPRSRVNPLPLLKSLLPSVSAHDSSGFHYSSMALCEHARLVLRMFSHSADQQRTVAADTVEMLPGATSRQMPSLSVSDGGRTIEYVYGRRIKGSAGAPAILMLHDDGSYARDLVPLAYELMLKGYHVLLVSQPGYGTSSGEPDLMGPATMSAINHALDALRRTPGVDSTRVGVWGAGRGANIAARLAMSRTGAAAVVASGGLYDLPAIARTSNRLRDQFAKEAGPDTSAWRDRSPGAWPPKLNAPLLVIHSPTDLELPAAQATAFVGRLRDAGLSAELRLVVGITRPVPLGDERTTAMDFFDRWLTPGP